MSQKKPRIIQCRVCNGTGKVLKQDASGQWKTCPVCQGTGRVREVIE